ncbi:MAG: carbohydrate-binding protein [Oscillospiraceae bacterium]|nr:carbohydrate-binding protein [Oscillospiraceae bacterium]
MKRTHRLLAGLTGLALAASMGALLPVSTAAAEIAFYVSPDGSANGSGTLSDPFGSLTAAKNAAREYSGDVTIYLRGGDYRLTEPVVFTPEDSGHGGVVTYKAYEDETPVISGAVKVTGWQQADNGLWKAPLDRDTKLRSFYVGDHRANMGSISVQGQGGYGQYGISKGQADWAWDSGTKSDGVAYNIGDFPRITSDYDDLEIVNGTTWNENIVCTRDIKADGNSLILLMQQPYGAIAQTPGWGAGFSCNSWHTIYNALEFVKNPGEFFFDKSNHIVYYYPLPGEDMSTIDAEAPVADKLIVIAGESTDKRVENIAFDGITFAYTDYQLTDVAGSHGKTTCQAAQTYTAFADSNWHKYKYEMADTLPAAVHITNASNIAVRNSVVKHTGADGISMTNDVVDSEITGNYITDITSSGITIGHPQHIYIGDASWDNHEKFAKGVEGVCSGVTVSQNMLYDISVVHGFGGCAAITTYYGDHIHILHNTIEKTAYNGIHLGWGWCNFKDSTTCHDNQICYNRVIGSLNRLHDSGGIYTIGQMPGTIINENYIQGIPAGRPGAPTYGLHNDEGTAWIEENDNILEIDPNVTYTINCEDYGQKHHLNIARTYATVNKMGIDPPDSKIDRPIVVSDNVWPFTQYKFCLNSGVEDAYRDLVPGWLTPAADYVFPASCQTTCGSKLPIRKAGNTVWIAPDDTTTFKAGATMTKAAANATTIKTPETEGEYRIYVVDASGKVLSKSRHLLRLSGSSAGIEAESFDYQSGIDLENCSEGGTDVAYIENGDYIGFKGIDLTGGESIDFRIGSNGATAALEVHIDKPDGTLIGKMDVKGTGGWQKWETQNCPIEATSGVHDLYFIFTGDEGYLYNLNWWKLNAVEVPPVLGDLNGDDTVDIFDLALLKKAVLTGETDYFRNADVDGDGELTTLDVVAHTKFIHKLITAFPASE